MKKGVLTKLVLIVLFIGFFISATISYTLWKNHADNTVAYFALVIIAVMIWIFAQIRLQEIWENKTYFVSVLMVLLMITFPFTSPMALYYLIKTPKTPKEGEKFFKAEEKNDISTDNLEDTLQEQQSSTNSREVVKIIGFVISIAIILIITSFFFKKDEPDNELNMTMNYDLQNNKSPMSLISWTGESLNEPYQEFLNKETTMIYTKDYPNSKGINLAIKYPKSWNINEWNGQNIILKWSSAISNLIQRNFLILVRENTEKITLNDLRLNWKDQFRWVDGIEYKDGWYITLWWQWFSWDLYYTTTKQDGIDLFMQTLVYSTIIDSKFVQIQFASVSWIKGDMEVDKVLRKISLKKELLEDIMLYDSMIKSLEIKNI